MKVLIACLMLSASLGASSVEPWVGGTRPYENVPYRELNAGGFATLGGTHLGGIRLDYGILDHWSVQGTASRDDAAPSAGIWNLGTQIRLGEEGQYWLDSAAFASGGQRQVDDGSSQSAFQGGLVLAKHWLDSDLALNAIYESQNGLGMALGYRSPYFYSTAQIGMEIESNGQGQIYRPQLSVSLPGDITLQGGGQWLSQGGDPSWIFSLSYEMFPSP